MDEPNDLPALAIATRNVYERHAARFDAERPKCLVERAWLSRFLSLLPDSARILDAGCGAGDPIAAHFIGQGHAVTGIDSAASAISIARSRFPDAEWQVMDMRALDLPGSFDGIVGWHSFFHLTPDEQPDTLRRFAEHLRPGGALLLTVGPAAGEVIGQICGEPVYHASLAPDDYGRILDSLGLHVVELVFEDPDCDLATVLLAQKTAA